MPQRNFEDARSHSKIVDVKVDIPEKKIANETIRTREFEQSKSSGNVWRIDSGREKTKTNLGRWHVPGSNFKNESCEEEEYKAARRKSISHHRNEKSVKSEGTNRGTTKTRVVEALESKKQ